MRQLERREAIIVYDPGTESIDIVVRRPADSRAYQAADASYRRNR